MKTLGKQLAGSRPYGLIVVLGWLLQSQSWLQVAGKIVVVELPEQISQVPTGVNYDNPFYATNISGTVIGYSANQVCYRITTGATVDAVLPEPVPINLSRGSALDTCGSWLNAVMYDPSEDVVRGWYHEEWECDYARNSYTNKSIAYAESHDGGYNFSKPNYPDNYIITSPPGNSSTTHQTGEGDHTVVRVGDYYYLYFLDWNAQPTGPRVAVARSHVQDGGRPNSWWKWHHGNFSSPGRGGECDALEGIASASSVRYRTRQNDFVAVEPPQLDAHTEFAHSQTWDREANSPELYAYISLVGPGGAEDIDTNFYLYYTYLEVPDLSATETLLAFQGGSNGTHAWATTALMLRAYNYSARTLGYLLTRPASGRRALYDCYLNASAVYMTGLEGECADGIILRTLGYAADAATTLPAANGFAPVQLWRCKDASSARYITTTSACASGATSSSLGWILTRTQA
ncbi:uncharacterized protein MONBRDRAFT_27516 [Monosiga brevicollis MX1]|uniref:Uncharacterized protein n=1 Tax=Monosiga brevicollis TaxID=81824 RepID=A9V5H7_MONBE|nr:uncharacterized protein MONBRDRAFT_27516 [Monosiga brevicollis MX1]EDQ87286.1 predicted protein [Monosiga brevicollis MX1]|eukprot:XP_001747899.1 hypothetical protein [Monosiga brevicollis MX1]